MHHPQQPMVMVSMVLMMRDDQYLSQQVPLNLYGWSKHIFDRLIP